MGCESEAVPRGSVEATLIPLTAVESSLWLSEGNGEAGSLAGMEVASLGLSSRCDVLQKADRQHALLIKVLRYEAKNFQLTR